MAPSLDATNPPNEHECEKASNSYLISLVALMAGLPLPVVNLIATAMFFLANRRAERFVRWHCTQALLGQVAALMMNVAGVYWTLAILLGSHAISNVYIAYMVVIVAANLTEFIATIYAAIRTRKGRQVSWYFFGPLTDLLVKG